MEKTFTEVELLQQMLAEKNRQLEAANKEIAKLKKEISDLNSTQAEIKVQIPGLSLESKTSINTEDLEAFQDPEEISLQKKVSLAFVKKLSQLTNNAKKMREITIKFKPPSQLRNAEVMIMGNFNGYMPSLMERYTDEEVKAQGLEDDPAELLDTYFFKTQVLKGFSYRYYFSVIGHDEFIIDET